jgi:hypothetical protein
LSDYGRIPDIGSQNRSLAAAVCGFRWNVCLWSAGTRIVSLNAPNGFQVLVDRAYVVSVRSLKLGHGMICSRAPSNGFGMQPEYGASVQVGWRLSKSVPCLMISRNSANVWSPSGGLVLGVGVKFLEIMCAESTGAQPTLRSPVLLRGRSPD